MEQQQIDPSQGTDIKCEECGSIYFIEVVTFKKFSKFLTGADKDSVSIAPVFRCADCGHVNKEFQA
jgi:uncharacterized Zn finger protein